MAICWKVRLVSGATRWFNLNQLVKMRPVRIISRKDQRGETVSQVLGDKSLCELSVELRIRVQVSGTAKSPREPVAER